MNDQQIQNSLDFIKGLPAIAHLSDFAITKTIGIALIALEQLQEARAEIEEMKRLKKPKAKKRYELEPPTAKRPAGYSNNNPNDEW